MKTYNVRVEFENDKSIVEFKAKTILSIILKTRKIIRLNKNESHILELTEEKDND